MASYKFSYDKMPNIFKKFPNEKYNWTEKIDGSNIVAFSNGDICGRNHKLIEKNGKLCLNGYDLKELQDNLKPIFLKMKEELGQKIKCEFDINIIGELILKDNNDLQKKYNYKERFQVGDVYFFGMKIFNCKFNISELLDFSTKLCFVDEEIYYDIMFDANLKEFFNSKDLKTPNYFGEMTFDEAIEKEEIINHLKNSSIEGFVLSNISGTMKFKNIFENENSLNDIKILLKENENNCLEKIKKIYETTNNFLSEDMLKALIQKTIGKGLDESKTKKEQLNRLCNDVSNDLKELDYFYPSKKLNAIVKKLFEKK